VAYYNSLLSKNFDLNVTEKLGGSSYWWMSSHNWSRASFRYCLYHGHESGTKSLSELAMLKMNINLHYIFIVRLKVIKLRSTYFVREGLPQVWSFGHVKPKWPPQGRSSLRLCSMTSSMVRWGVWGIFQSCGCPQNGQTFNTYTYLRSMTYASRYILYVNESLLSHTGGFGQWHSLRA